MTQGIRVAFAALWIGAGVMGSGAQTVYVDAANNSGVENGSPASPYNTLQEGVNAASNGWTVQVANGVYTNPVNIISRRALTLSGSGTNTVVTNLNIKIWVQYSADITIQNFDVKGGQWQGIFVDRSTNVSIHDNTIENINQDPYQAIGALYIVGSTFTIEHNVIRNNYGGQYGGAGYIGGSGIIRSNDFINNLAWNNSGGLAITTGSTSLPLRITGNYFESCRADYSGAIQASGNASSLTIDHNVMYNCGATYGAGGALKLYYQGDTNTSVRIVNNVFRDPIANVRQMITMSAGASVYIANNVFSSTVGGFAVIADAGSAISMEYNDVWGMSLSGATNAPGGIAANPMFVNQSARDYHLQAGSPCIDAGNPASQYNDADGSRNDMGVFGGLAAVSTNHAPVANGNTVTTPEDTARQIQLTGSDPDGNAIAFSVVTTTSHGTLTGVDSNRYYTPVADYNGTDTFTFVASDGLSTSTPATVSIVVTPSNDSPRALDSSYTTFQGVAISTPMNAWDPDGDPLQVSVSDPAHGSVTTGVFPNVTYTPDPGFVGFETFSYTVIDPSTQYSFGLISVEVKPVYTGLVIYVDDSNVSGIENGTTTYPFNTIQEGVNVAPSGYVIAVAAGSYTENVSIVNRSNVFISGAGNLSMVYSASGGYRIVVSNAANVVIQNLRLRGGSFGLYAEKATGLALLNDLFDGFNSSGGITPLSAASSSIRVEGCTFSGGGGRYSTFGGYFYDSDVCYASNTVSGNSDWNSGYGVSIYNDETNASRKIRTRHNQILYNGSSLVGINVGGYAGAQVDHNIFSGTGSRYEGMISLRPLGGAAMKVENNVLRDNPGEAFDQARKDIYIYNGTTGSVLIANNIFSDTNGYAVYNVSPFMPTVEYNDLFQMSNYNVTAGSGNIPGNPLFANPYAANDGHLLAGSPCINAGNPAPYYNDVDGSRNDMGIYGGNWTNVASGGGSSNTAPVAQSQNVSTPEDTAKAITLVATDAETNPLTYAIVANPSAGSLSGTPPNVTYTPAANYNGADSFTFRASDGSLTGNVATVSITVTPVNDAPQAYSQVTTTLEDNAKSITLVATDIDSTGLTYAIVLTPAHGSLSGTMPNVIYTPALDYNGSDTFRFTASDGVSTSMAGTVSVNITAVNDAPVAQSQSVTTTQNVSKAIRVVATDVDGPSLAYSLATGPANGTLSGTLPNVTYTPALNFSGADAFTFRASDGQATSGVATVNITVVPGVLPPVIGKISNQSTNTVCAEVDNINIPLCYSNVTSYRITATHPLYLPTSISVSGANFTNCSGFNSVIWYIGSLNSSYTEFLQSGFASGDVYYPIDAPAAGVDEAVTQLPREIATTTITNQYFYFTMDGEGENNNESKIGANFYVYFAQVTGTLQLKLLTWNGSAWVDRGNRTFTSASYYNNWSIPDLAWLAGTDANRIQLRVVSTAEGGVTTAGALARYDYLQLVKRSETGESVGASLFDNGDVVVTPVKVDFWWRSPNTMSVNVLGGRSTNGVQYFRISKKIAGANSWPEVFVLYEDGNARITPHPPVGVSSVPYATSVILGPTTNSPRPAIGISSVTINPTDLSLDITYKDGNTAHVEMWVDREQNVVDVTGMTHNMASNSFARIRSMWVQDGNADLDRIESQSGETPVLDNWSTLPGSWWQFYRAVPSYHNTYASDIRVEVMDPATAFMVREAESLNAGSNFTVTARSAASAGQTIMMSSLGGQATYNVTMTQSVNGVAVRLRYAHANGNNLTTQGNLVQVYVDGVLKDQAKAGNTGGDNVFEIAPTFYLGSLAAGAHTVKIVTGAGSYTIDLDRLDFVSQTPAPATRYSLAVQQAESFAAAAGGYSVVSRSNATGGLALAISASGGNATYNISVAAACTNAYVQIRYADVLGPNRVNVYVDNVLKGLFPSETTGTNVFKNSAEVYIGNLSAGTRQIKLETSPESQGVELDQFEVLRY